MPELSDIELDLPDWVHEDIGSNRSVWRNKEGDLLEVFFINIPPDIEKPLNDVEGLRDFYRKLISEAGMGLISIDVQPIGSIPSVRGIAKHPQKPSGMTYIGSWTIPFAEFSFVIRVQCMEHGLTGVRDTAVLHRMLDAGMVEMNESTDQVEGWFRDPYGAEISSPVSRNLSDDAEWDERFPDHPLSRCRRHLDQILRSVALSDELLAAPLFSGPQSPAGAGRKSWWRRWTQ